MYDKIITEERADKLRRLVAQKQRNLAVILEGVHDPHNVGAVLRSCDSVGVGKVFLIAPENVHSLSDYIGKSTTSRGAYKWLDIQFFKSTETCLEKVVEDGYLIFSTHLSVDSTDLYELDLTQKVALMFGNEHTGLSDKALTMSNQNFLIPQMGMVQSLNISVACAVSLYECYRQRSLKGNYNQIFSEEILAHQNDFEKLVKRHRKIKE